MDSSCGNPTGAFFLCGFRKSENLRRKSKCQTIVSLSRSTGTPIEVNEEVYRAYYQPIWNTRYHAQKNGECRCTKAQLWKCDGVCPGCPFYAAGKKVSIDTPIGGEEDELTLGDTLADDAPSAESILMDKELLDALYEELNRLDPDGRRICELIMQGKTEREIAADMGKRQSTINYQKNKAFSILREALKDFI